MITGLDGTGQCACLKSWPGCPSKVGKVFKVHTLEERKRRRKV